MKKAAFVTGLALALAAPIAAAQADKHDCKSPEFPGRLASANQIKSFEKRATEYSQCIKAFVDARSVAVKAATDEYNVWLADVRKQQGKEEKPAEPEKKAY